MRPSLGLRALDLDDWLDVDEHYAEEMAEKARLLRERRGDVVAHLPRGRAAAQETLDLVRAWMGEHHPGLVVDDTDVSSRHPVDTAGRLVQEDLCVLTRDDGRWRLTAASVCFPSRWRLADKIGATVADIHDPVPDYRDTIGHVVDRSLDRLEVARPLWRRNWSILDDESLFQPTAARGQRPAPVALSDLTLRVERQTLRRLPETSGVLFTIRTYRRRLDDVARDHATARQLAASLRTCSPELAAYKGWAGMLGWLIDTLDAVPEAAGAPG